MQFAYSALHRNQSDGKAACDVSWIEWFAARCSFGIRANKTIKKGEHTERISYRCALHTHTPTRQRKQWHRLTRYGKLWILSVWHYSDKTEVCTCIPVQITFLMRCSGVTMSSNGELCTKKWAACSFCIRRRRANGRGCFWLSYNSISSVLAFSFSCCCSIIEDVTFFTAASPGRFHLAGVKWGVTSLV